MISNMFGLEVFYAAFKDACGDQYDNKNNYGVIDSKKFNHALN